MTRNVRKATPSRVLERINPIAVAVSKEKMRRHLVTFGIEIYLTDDGAPAQELLAHLGWVLSVGAEIAARVMPGCIDAKRLHAALRSVLHMSVDGGRWVASQAGVLHQAAKESNALMFKHPDLGTALIDDADHIASRIRTGIATLSDVAGPEIYAAAAAPGQTA